VNWRALRWIALGRLILTPFFGLIGVGLVLAANNPVGRALGGTLVIVAAAGFAQAILDFRRSGRAL
jgi:hypothetical protein